MSQAAAACRVLGMVIAIILAARSGTTVAGDEEAESATPCISIRHVKRTEVIDDRTVLFYMSGGQIRKVTLAFHCSSLKFYRSFSYRVYTSRLCPRVSEIISRSGSHCPIGDIETISTQEAASLMARDGAADKND
ncbi:MAG: hypothetical protein D6763_07985 [Alphaproteobacteria bacterium]|nr:MAG: hypothetical protein D6763_07985 [Alphaproteobacteria bacterium]